MILQKTRTFVLFCILACTALVLPAQEEGGNLEKKIQNPIASLISVPFQNNTDFGANVIDPITGEFHDRARNTLNIQPVVPFQLGEKVNLIARTIIPIVSLPLNIDKTQSGLGDINMSLYLTPSKPSKVIYGAGLALILPTAMHPEILGSEKFSMGPGVVALTQPGTWTIGGLIQNTWSVAGNSDRDDVNFFYSQIFVVKGLKKGWYINSAPIITANWDGESGEKWTIPMGAGMGKLFKVGKLPINAQLGWYRYLEAPTNGPEHQFRAQVVFLFPK